MRGTSDLLTLADFERRARRLPRAVCDLIDAGAGDEVTVRANRSAYERIVLRPRALRDVSARSLETTVLEQRLKLPVLLAPCGFARMVHRDGELAVARAAASVGTAYVLSSGASYAPAEVVAAGGGAPIWLGLYMRPERADTEALIAAGDQAGCSALCVTVDGQILLARDRDYRNRVTVPLRATPRTVLGGLRTPGWLWDFARGRVARGRGFPAERVDYWSFATTVNYTKSVTAEDLAWLRERWHGPLVVKGIMRSEECETLIDCGVDAVIVSNHGGRLLDGTAATIDVLPEILAAIGGRAEVLVDGGIRRGSDVLKALALGARACLVGRPYLWGLAADGQAGVERLLEVVRRELEQAMALAGCAAIDDIDSSIAR